MDGVRAVWKFNVPCVDFFELEMPVGSQPLSVQVQFDDVQLWCLCDPNEVVIEKRTFRLAGTGHPIDTLNLAFIGTFQMLNGNLVLHLFEVK